MPLAQGSGMVLSRVKAGKTPGKSLSVDERNKSSRKSSGYKQADGRGSRARVKQDSLGNTPSQEDVSQVEVKKTKRRKKKKAKSNKGSGGNLLRAARSGNIERLILLLDEEKIDINSSNSSGLNCLHLASKEGHENVVLELLKRGMDINQATKRGNTALHIASLAGKISIVRILVENNADTNCQAQNAFTPLYMAAQEGHEDIVDFLLKSGANQSLATEDGFTPLAVALQEGRDKVVALLLDNDVKGRVKLPALHIAARKDDVKAAALLLQNDHTADVTSKMMVNRTTESGFTALHIAAHYGNTSVAQLLLNRGAAVDFTAKNDITPLHVACKRGHTRFCALLLDRNANIDARTRDGLAPIHCAARSGHKPVVKLLLDRTSGSKLPRTKNGLSALHMATQGGHTSIVKLLLTSNYPVDDSTLDYLTALHIAAHCGHVSATKVLLDTNAKVDSQAMNGFTPLHVACKKNRINIVEILLENKASTEAVTESGLTPLHVACFMGHEEIVRLLLEHSARLDTFNTRGETALHMATRSGQKNIVQLLMRNGANPDARKQESQTPLHLAARLDKVEIAKILLQHGAVIDEMMRDDYTPLHVAAKEGHHEMCEMLISNGASVTKVTKKGFTPLHLAAKYGRLEVCDLLLKKQSSPDATGKNGLTPLHVAAHYDNQQVALLLLKNGASAHAAGKNGYTPLHIAAQKNQLEIAITLLEYGASCTSKTRMEVTPLHLAAQAGHVDMCSLLLAKDAKVNDQAKHGLTSMHLAAQDDRVAVAKILYDNNSLVDPLTKGGYTPLHTACYHGNVPMVQYLLSLGAKVNAKTKNGYTPLHLAAQQGHANIAELLIKFGASPNELTNSGNTALSLAKKLGYITCVETLTTVTTEISTTEISDEKRKHNMPETVNEDFLSDASDDEEDGITTGGNYLTTKELQELGDDSIVPQTVVETYAARESRVMPATPDKRPSSWKSNASDDSGRVRERKTGGFLVSFLVDARGGMMNGTRHPDLRIIIPPKACGGPTRVTCRLARRQNITRSSAAMGGGVPLYESEGKASRVLELGQNGSRFLEPVAIEIPHFGNTRGCQREIIIIRSEDGENWSEHKQVCSDQEFCNNYVAEELESSDELSKKRVIRVITDDFPKFFALVSRVKEDACQVGPQGGVLESVLYPGAKTTFPEGALKKEIQVGIQVQNIPEDVCKRVIGSKAKASPIVTIEPRRRKFHRPITLSIPLPDGCHMKDYLSSTEDPTLRLLCSIAGGTDPAQWEDITGSTPLTFQENSVSFTTTVSAKFWLLDCTHSSESSEIAMKIYDEVTRVPYMAQFAVFARSVDTNHAEVRVYCTTDDRLERTLESQEHFTQVARSKDVEVLENMSVFMEMSGNITSTSKTQHSCLFRPLDDNIIICNVKIRDMTQDPIGRLTFFRDPKGSKVHGARKPLCSLNITIPQYEKDLDSDDGYGQINSVDSTPTRLSSDITSVEAKKRYYLVDPSSVDLFEYDSKHTTPEEIAHDVREVVDKLNEVKALLQPDSTIPGEEEMILKIEGKDEDTSIPHSASMEETSQVVQEVKESLQQVKGMLENQALMEKTAEVKTVKDDTKTTKPIPKQRSVTSKQSKVTQDTTKKSTPTAVNFTIMSSRDIAKKDPKIAPKRKPMRRESPSKKVSTPAKNFNTSISPKHGATPTSPMAGSVTDMCRRFERHHKLADEVTTDTKSVTEQNLPQRSSPSKFAFDKNAGAPNRDSIQSEIRKDLDILSNEISKEIIRPSAFPAKNEVKGNYQKALDELSHYMQSGVESPPKSQSGVQNDVLKEEVTVKAVNRSESPTHTRTKLNQEELTRFLADDLAKFNTATKRLTSPRKSPAKIVKFNENVTFVPLQSLDWEKDFKIKPYSGNQDRTSFKELPKSKSITQRVLDFEAAKTELESEVHKFKKDSSDTSKAPASQTTTKQPKTGFLDRSNTSKPIITEKSPLLDLKPEVLRENNKTTSPVVVEESHGVSEILKNWGSNNQTNTVTTATLQSPKELQQAQKDSIDQQQQNKQLSKVSLSSHFGTEFIVTPKKTITVHTSSFTDKNIVSEKSTLHEIKLKDKTEDNVITSSVAVEESHGVSEILKSWGSNNQTNTVTTTTTTLQSSIKLQQPQQDSVDQHQQYTQVLKVSPSSELGTEFIVTPKKRMPAQASDTSKIIVPENSSLLDLEPDIKMEKSKISSPVVVEEIHGVSEILKNWGANNQTNTVTTTELQKAQCHSVNTSTSKVSSSSIFGTEFIVTPKQRTTVRTTSITSTTAVPEKSRLSDLEPDNEAKNNKSTSPVIVEESHGVSEVLKNWGVNIKTYTETTTNTTLKSSNEFQEIQKITIDHQDKEIQKVSSSSESSIESLLSSDSSESNESGSVIINPHVPQRQRGLEIISEEQIKARTSSGNSASSFGCRESVSGLTDVFEDSDISQSSYVKDSVETRHRSIDVASENEYKSWETEHQLVADDKNFTNYVNNTKTPSVVAEHHTVTDLLRNWETKKPQAKVRSRNASVEIEEAKANALRQAPVQSETQLPSQEKTKPNIEVEKRQSVKDLIKSWGSPEKSISSTSQKSNEVETPSVSSYTFSQPTCSDNVVREDTLEYDEKVKQENTAVNEQNQTTYSDNEHATNEPEYLDFESDEEKPPLQKMSDSSETINNVKIEDFDERIKDDVNHDAQRLDLTKTRPKVVSSIDSQSILKKTITEEMEILPAAKMAHVQAEIISSTTTCEGSLTQHHMRLPDDTSTKLLLDDEESGIAMQDFVVADAESILPLTHIKESERKNVEASDYEFQMKSPELYRQTLDQKLLLEDVSSEKENFRELDSKTVATLDAEYTHTDTNFPREQNVDVKVLPSGEMKENQEHVMDFDKLIDSYDAAEKSEIVQDAHDSLYTSAVNAICYDEQATTDDMKLVQGERFEELSKPNILVDKNNGMQFENYYSHQDIISSTQQPNIDNENKYESKNTSKHPNDNGVLEIETNIKHKFITESGYKEGDDSVFIEEVTMQLQTQSSKDICSTEETTHYEKFEKGDVVIRQVSRSFHSSEDENSESSLADDSSLCDLTTESMKCLNHIVDTEYVIEQEDKSFSTQKDDVEHHIKNSGLVTSETESNGQDDDSTTYDEISGKMHPNNQIENESSDLIKTYNVDYAVEENNAQILIHDSHTDTENICGSEQFVQKDEHDALHDFVRDYLVDDNEKHIKSLIKENNKPTQEDATASLSKENWHGDIQQHCVTTISDQQNQVMNMESNYRYQEEIFSHDTMDTCHSNEEIIQDGIMLTKDETNQNSYTDAPVTFTSAVMQQSVPVIEIEGDMWKQSSDSESEISFEGNAQNVEVDEKLPSYEEVTSSTFENYPGDDSFAFKSSIDQESCVVTGLSESDTEVKKCWNEKDHDETAMSDTYTDKNKYITNATLAGRDQIPSYDKPHSEKDEIEFQKSRNAEVIVDQLNLQETILDESTIGSVYGKPSNSSYQSVFEQQMLPSSQNKQCLNSDGNEKDRTSEFESDAAQNKQPNTINNCQTVNYEEATHDKNDDFDIMQAGVKISSEYGGESENSASFKSNNSSQINLQGFSQSKHVNMDKISGGAICLNDNQETNIIAQKESDSFESFKQNKEQSNQNIYEHKSFKEQIEGDEMNSCMNKSHHVDVKGVVDSDNESQLFREDVKHWYHHTEQTEIDNFEKNAKSKVPDQSINSPNHEINSDTEIQMQPDSEFVSHTLCESIHRTTAQAIHTGYMQSDSAVDLADEILKPGKKLDEPLFTDNMKNVADSTKQKQVAFDNLPSDENSMQSESKTTDLQIEEDSESDFIDNKSVDAGNFFKSRFEAGQDDNLHATSDIVDGHTIFDTSNQQEEDKEPFYNSESDSELLVCNEHNTLQNAKMLQSVQHESYLYNHNQKDLIEDVNVDKLKNAKDISALKIIKLEDDESFSRKINDSQGVSTHQIETCDEDIIFPSFSISQPDVDKKIILPSNSIDEDKDFDVYESQMEENYINFSPEQHKEVSAIEHNTVEDCILYSKNGSNKSPNPLLFNENQVRDLDLKGGNWGTSIHTPEDEPKFFHQIDSESFTRDTSNELINATYQSNFENFDQPEQSCDLENKEKLGDKIVDNTKMTTLTEVEHSQEIESFKTQEIFSDRVSYDEYNYELDQEDSLLDNENKGFSMDQPKHLLDLYAEDPYATNQDVVYTFDGEESDSEVRIPIENSKACQSTYHDGINTTSLEYKNYLETHRPKHDDDQVDMERNLDSPSIVVEKATCDSFGGKYLSNVTAQKENASTFKNKESTEENDIEIEKDKQENDFEYFTKNPNKSWDSSSADIEITHHEFTENNATTSNEFDDYSSPPNDEHSKKSIVGHQECYFTTDFKEAAISDIVVMNEHNLESKFSESNTDEQKESFKKEQNFLQFDVSTSTKTTSHDKPVKHEEVKLSENCSSANISREIDYFDYDNKTELHGTDQVHLDYSSYDTMPCYNTPNLYNSSEMVLDSAEDRHTSWSGSDSHDYNITDIQSVKLRQRVSSEDYDLSSNRDSVYSDVTVINTFAVDDTDETNVEQPNNVVVPRVVIHAGLEDIEDELYQNIIVDDNHEDEKIVDDSENETEFKANDGYAEKGFSDAEKKGLVIGKDGDIQEYDDDKQHSGSEILSKTREIFISGEDLIETESINEEVFPDRIQHEDMNYKRNETYDESGGIHSKEYRSEQHVGYSFSKSFEQSVDYSEERPGMDHCGPTQLNENEAADKKVNNSSETTTGYNIENRLDDDSIQREMIEEFVNEIIKDAELEVRQENEDVENDQIDTITDSPTNIVFDDSGDEQSSSSYSSTKDTLSASEYSESTANEDIDVNIDEDLPQNSLFCDKKDNKIKITQECTTPKNSFEVDDITDAQQPLEMTAGSIKINIDCFGNLADKEKVDSSRDNNVDNSSFLKTFSKVVTSTSQDLQDEQNPLNIPSFHPPMNQAHKTDATIEHTYVATAQLIQPQAGFREESVKESSEEPEYLKHSTLKESGFETLDNDEQATLFNYAQGITKEEELTGLYYDNRKYENMDNNAEGKATEAKSLFQEVINELESRNENSMELNNQHGKERAGDGNDMNECEGFSGQLANQMIDDSSEYASQNHIINLYCTKDTNVVESCGNNLNDTVFDKPVDKQYKDMHHDDSKESYEENIKFAEDIEDGALESSPFVPGIEELQHPPYNPFYDSADEAADDVFSRKHIEFQPNLQTEDLIKDDKTAQDTMYDFSAGLYQIQTSTSPLQISLTHTDSEELDEDNYGLVKTGVADRITAVSLSGNTVTVSHLKKSNKSQAYEFYNNITTSSTKNGNDTISHSTVEYVGKKKTISPSDSLNESEEVDVYKKQIEPQIEDEVFSSSFVSTPQNKKAISTSDSVNDNREVDFYRHQMDREDESSSTSSVSIPDELYQYSTSTSSSSTPTDDEFDQLAERRASAQESVPQIDEENINRPPSPLPPVISSEELEKDLFITDTVLEKNQSTVASADGEGTLLDKDMTNRVDKTKIEEDTHTILISNFTKKRSIKKTMIPTPKVCIFKDADVKPKSTKKKQRRTNSEDNLTKPKHRGSRIPVQRSTSLKSPQKGNKGSDHATFPRRNYKSKSNMNKSSSVMNSSSKSCSIEFVARKKPAPHTPDLNYGIYTYRDHSNEKSKIKDLSYNKYMHPEKSSSSSRDSVASIVFSGSSNDSTPVKRHSLQSLVNKAPFALDYDESEETRRYNVTTTTTAEESVHTTQHSGTQQTYMTQFGSDENPFLLYSLGLDATSGSIPGNNTDSSMKMEASYCTTEEVHHLFKEKTLDMETKAWDMEFTQDTTKEHPTSRNTGYNDDDDIKHNDALLQQVASKIGLQWKQLATELEMTNEEIWEIEKMCVDAEPGERSFLMLLQWKEMNKEKAHNDEILKRALASIDRSDALESDVPQIQVQNVEQHNDISGFSDLDAELGGGNLSNNHVSSPFPFSPQANSTMKEGEKENVPLYSNTSEDMDDPSKPHFIYVESTSVNDEELKPSEIMPQEGEVFESSQTQEMDKSHLSRSSSSSHSSVSNEENIVDQLLEEKLKDQGNTEVRMEIVQTEYVERRQHSDEEEIRTTIKRTIVVDEEDVENLNLPPTVVEVTNTESGTVQVTREVKRVVVDENTSSSESD